MKPMLSLDAMLGGGAGHAAAGPSPTDDLEHRLLQIVWANGEGLDTTMPTRGSALLQHGFKEWAAARGVSTLASGAGGARRVDGAALLQELRRCDAENWMPLVLCRDAEPALQALVALLAEGPCTLLALGAPSSLRLAPGRPDPAGALFPLRLPPGVDPGQCLWLGAPDGLSRRALGLPGALRVASAQLQGTALAEHLHAAESRLGARGAQALWCVLFLDDVELGSAPATAPAGVPAEALAATLRWLQRQVPSVYVFAVSHERITPAQRGAVAALARHLGGALYRHAGVAREAFAPPLQKKR